MSVGAVVLCGGESRRMGRPKAWLPFGEEVLLERVVRLVRKSATRVVVVGAVGQVLPRLAADVGVARDPLPGRGPLQGIEVGLSALSDSIEFAYVTATDAPLLAEGWIGRLAERIGDADLAIPKVGGFLQPLAALYRRATVGPAVGSLLARDILRPAALIDEVRTVLLDPSDFRDVDPTLATIRNLNDPSEYRATLDALGLFPARLVVEFFGVPRLLAGVASLVVEANRVGEALRLVGIECPGLVGGVIRGGSVQPSYKLSLNGDRFLDDPDTPLIDGDCLLLLAADVGG